MKNILIIEDNADNIIVYKLLLKEYNLYIYNELNKAVDFIRMSDEINNIHLAILDINMGTGLKISGFNIFYYIYKKCPSIPIVICTAYSSEEKVQKYANLINAEIVEKPINSDFQKIINNILDRKLKLYVDEFEQLFREFITGIEYVRFLFSKDLSINIEVVNELDSLSKKEQSFLDFFKNKSGDKDFSEKLNSDAIFYIQRCLSIINNTLYSELNISKEEIEFIEEISSVGEKLLQI